MPTRRHVLYGFGAAGASAFALRAGSLFSTPAVARTAIEIAVPPNACDCHVHVFDPAHFPYVAKRVYTPPAASVEDLLALHTALRMDRVVVVQPSVYGADNACTLDAVRRLGNRARAVAVIDKTTTKTALDEMAGTGVRASASTSTPRRAARSMPKARSARSTSRLSRSPAAAGTSSSTQGRM
jgi:predicted TIM-barrel fold metal-dependent hydrolase